MKKLIPFILCAGLIGCGFFKKSVDADKPEESKRPISPASQVGTKNIDPGKRPGVLNTSIQFLPSYQSFGGAHLKIDTLNTVIYLDDEILTEIKNYIKTQEAEAASDTSRASVKIVRYYATDSKLSDLLLNQISPEKAQDQAHFRGTFDEHGNLLTLEFISEDAVKAPDRDNLEFSYASYWNILFHKPMDYWNKEGYRSPAHAKIYADEKGIVRHISYAKEGKGLAAGVFTYGVKNLILEQRIVFRENGKLSDLHPDYFSPKFGHIGKNWVAKCLYGRDNVMSDLIVMLDAGVVFYRYRFNEVKLNSGKLIAASVFDAEEKLVDRYELFFDDEGNLLKKTLLTLDGKTTGHIRYTVDVDNFKMIVDNYDNLDNHIDRFYREL